MSKIKIHKLVFLFLIIAVLCIGCYICYCFRMLQKMEYNEILRLNSPDGKVDAVLIEGNGGAATSYSYSLYVVPFGCKITEKDIRKDRYVAVFVAEKMEDKKITWLENKFLKIEYKKARIFAFRNHVYPLPEDTRYEVEIRETPLTSSSSLSGTHPENP